MKTIKTLAGGIETAPHDGERIKVTLFLFNKDYADLISEFEPNDIVECFEPSALLDGMDISDIIEYLDSKGIKMEE